MAQSGSINFFMFFIPPISCAMVEKCVTLHKVREVILADLLISLKTT